MKRSFLYLALGAMAALSACTSEDVLEDAVKQNNVIGFENVVNKHSRADIDNVNLTSFNVYGYYTITDKDNNNATVPVFKNVAVSGSNTDGWTYAGDKRYWVPNAHYFFYAYSYGDGATLTDAQLSWDVTDPTKRALKIVDFVCDNNNQHDLVFASATGDDGNGMVGENNDNPKVPLKFSHVLSKVKAQFTYAIPAGYTMEISNVYFSDFNNKGTYNGGTGEWESEKSEAAEVSLKDALTLSDPETDATKSTGETNEAYVIPFDYSEGETSVNLYFDIIIKYGDTTVLEKKGVKGHFKPKWQQGYFYTYNISITGDALNLEVINFDTDVSVDGWTEETVSDEDANTIIFD